MQPSQLIRSLKNAPYRGLASVSDKASQVIGECLTLRESAQEINDKYKGPLDKSCTKNTILPFVFLLGNHSSGKSSFINYLLQRPVQTAGVAPTDDSFTIIAPGPKDMDRDGPSFIGDPDMGFAGLRTFGPTLIHHTQLKVRANTVIQDLMIVDTPGMIDSPKVKQSLLYEDQESVSPGRGFLKSSSMDRGYDFEGVVKWYASRADVILLFFDPDKPGTTGETLAVLTNCLSGMDHKLHIILNKADQFSRIHDFARAYGSLCWNLSKVIHRKDLPRIYTMCLPKKFYSDTSVDRNDVNNSESSSLGLGLEDLEQTREDVVQEVLNAPLRRQNNEISRLTESLQMLQMHCSIMTDLMKQYRQAKWRYRAIMLSGITASTGAVAGVAILMPNPQILVPTACASAFLVAATHFFQSRALEEKGKSIISPIGLLSSYQRLYSKAILEHDEHIAHLWSVEEKHLSSSLSYSELASMNQISSSDSSKVDTLLEKNIPNLRRQAAPLLAK